LTSNLGFDSAKKGGGLGFVASTEKADYQQLKTKMLEEAKRIFKPELLNRFDDVVVFRQLIKKDVIEILELEMSKLKKRLSEKGKKLRLSKSAKEFLIEKGFDTALGARPLRRAIERYIENPLAEEILRGKLDGTEVVEIVATGNDLKFRQKTTVHK